MIDTLPQELQTRKEEWFQDRQKSRNYSWRELFDHFSELFGDQHVLETAVEQFCRIQQGRNQYFHDYVKEFDYKVAMCGGEDTYIPQGKSLHLRMSLNSRVKKALIGPPLPYPREHKGYCQDCLLCIIYIWR